MSARRILLHLVCAAATATGCFFPSTSDYQSASSGPVGCPPPEIVITNLDRQMYSVNWQATCRGRRFHCSGAGQTVTCTPEAPPSGWTPPPPGWAPAPVAPPPAPPVATVPPQAPAAAATTVVVMAPDGAAAGVVVDPSRESPARQEIQAALSAMRDRLRACAEGEAASVRTAIEFRGATGRPAQVTVTTDRGVPAATCIGQALLEITLAPFVRESLTVDYPWNL